MYIYTAAVQNYDTTTMIQLLYYTLYVINMILLLMYKLCL